MHPMARHSKLIWAQYYARNYVPTRGVDFSAADGMHYLSPQSLCCDSPIARALTTDTPMGSEVSQTTKQGSIHYRMNLLQSPFLSQGPAPSYPWSKSSGVEDVISRYQRTRPCDQLPSLWQEMQVATTICLNSIRNILQIP